MITRAAIAPHPVEKETSCSGRAMKRRNESENERSLEQQTWTNEIILTDINAKGKG